MSTCTCADKMCSSVFGLVFICKDCLWKVALLLHQVRVRCYVHQVVLCLSGGVVLGGVVFIGWCRVHQMVSCSSGGVVFIKWCCSSGGVVLGGVMFIGL